MNNFPYVIKEILKSEGGYKNDPAHDPGDPTNFGISYGTYKHKGMTPDDIKNLTKEKAEAIYERDYWLAKGLDKIIDPENAHIAMDSVVNHGQGGKLIQIALNTLGHNVKPDNIIGSATIAAINSSDPKKFQQVLYQVRKSYYETEAQNPAKAKYLKGWLKRISRWNTGVTLGGGLAGIAIIAAALYFFVFRKSRGT